MSYHKGNPFGYRMFAKVVWFDFDGPKYLIGKSCDLEFIDTKYLYFYMPQN